MLNQARQSYWLNEDAVKKATQQLIDKGQKAITIACDLTNEADLKAMMIDNPMNDGLIDGDESSRQKCWKAHQSAV